MKGRTILRKMYGPVVDTVSGEWRRRKNTELKTFYNELNVLDLIGWRRLRWAGHVYGKRNSLIRAVMEEGKII